MKYADEQIVRPQHENGCDYGHGRRSVLVRNGEKEILHCAGAKHWGGIGAGRYYSGVEIVAYPDTTAASCRQRTLYPTEADELAIKAAGKTKVVIGMKQWEQIAVEMFTHLGCEEGFPLKLISLKHTLLLDEPGDVTEPPRVPGPKKVHPRIESDRFCRIYEDPDTPGKCRYVETAIVKQGSGKLTYKLANGREVEKPVKQALEEGGGTREEAEATYLRYYEERAAEAALRLQRAAHSFAYNDDNLTEAKNRLEAMRKETP